MSYLDLTFNNYYRIVKYRARVYKKSMTKMGAVLYRQAIINSHYKTIQK